MEQKRWRNYEKALNKDFEEEELFLRPNPIWTKRQVEAEEALKEYIDVM